MKNAWKILLVLLLTQACTEKREEIAVDPVNWKKRMLNSPLSDSLENGSTYLSVYSQIYSQTEHKTHDLTVTVSIRNPNRADTLYLQKAEYFDTHGKLIRNYFNRAIFLLPMETIEIVIAEKDQDGGTGGNFLFDWAKHSKANEPIFESVMISTNSQQGISFTTQGKRI